MSKEYAKHIDIVMNDNKTSLNGLAHNEVLLRREQYGENILKERKQRTILDMILAQFKDVLTLVLIGAAIISIVVSGHLTDGIFIMIIVILNMVLSIIQEERASNALLVLKEMTGPSAKVIRNGETILIKALEVVPGDLVIIETGDYVPCDLRLVESINLEIQESALTGESLSVSKKSDLVLDTNTPLGDRVNMAYMSTIVTYGRGVGIAIATGMETAIGKIADLLNKVEPEPSPLEKRLNKLGKNLAFVALAVCAIIFAIGLIQGQEVIDIFMTSVSLAVAAIPEGLVAVVTVVLAVGMRRMVSKNAIMKELSAVETLGSTTVICTDKTGTLTLNKMVVRKVFDNSKELSVDGNGYELTGSISEHNHNVTTIGLISKHCNDSKIVDGECIGDPTEGSLIALASRIGIQDSYERVSELPFDSERKLMSTLHNVDGETVMYSKGAPDELLKKCSYYLEGGTMHEIDDSFVNRINNANNSFAKEAMRVLGFAFKSTKTLVEKDLVFVGLVGIIDPPRIETISAIEMCKEAGIRVVMITGDHKLTATAIGQNIGLLSKDDIALSGSELDDMSDEEFSDAVFKSNVFARVSPEHKVKIVKALKDNGEIAAMTGDGVNDAPALKQADIGIAMGITGTDVSKESSDMVLTDDNFNSIVDAVEEGRVIYSNIKKFIGFLLSCNIGEILIIFIAMLIGWGTPLLPVQILWINLITDSFPAFALGLEEKEDGIMRQQPRNPADPIIDKDMKITIIVQSIFLAFAVLISFRIGLSLENGTDLYIAETFAFVTLIIGELLRGYSARGNEMSLFKMRVFSNKFLNYAVLIGLLLLVSVVYISPLNSIFKTFPLYWKDLIIAMSLGLVPLVGGELAKTLKKN